MRSIILLSYVAIMLAVIYGISAVISYLNTGADRSKMLHTEVKKTEVYTPQVSWSPLQNEGRSVSPELLNTIEKDYLNAWYIAQVAYKTNTTQGVEDYYTEHAREEVYNFIRAQKEKNLSLESTTLKHILNLDFLSEDGQLAVLTDKGVIEYKRFLQDTELLYENSEQSYYKVILLLEDGFWRIRHKIKEKAAPYELNSTRVNGSDFKIKGINYYPQSSPWDTFGESFSVDTFEQDFEIIRSAGLNSIRIFVPYEDFGKAEVKSDKLKKLKALLNVAEDKKLKVVITLFDFYGDYSVLDWTQTQKHAEKVVNAVKDHNALLAWDIKNEPDLDFDSRDEALVTAWLGHMIDHVKTLDNSHPVTIGWSNPKSAELLSEHLDIISFHYYKDLEYLEQDIKDLRGYVPEKPIVMQEFGLSSYSGLWKPLSGSEEDQAAYHKKAQQIIHEQDVQFMSWTLYDFEEVPNTVTGWQPWRKKPQKAFGFIDQKGRKKASFKYISSGVN